VRAPKSGQYRGDFVARETKERATEEEMDTKREWLFPVILGVLLAGSVISFALAFVEAPPPHQETKSSAEHLRVSPSNSTERQR
jgi:hypothetical protein